MIDRAAPSPVTEHVGVLAVLPCEECGRPFEFARGARGHTRYCGSKCYNRAYNRAHPVARQKPLPLTPPPAPVPPVRDKRVSVADRPRLVGHNLRVLDRLYEGPATNVELAALLGPASAWRTRVSDVRRWAEKHKGWTVIATQSVVPGLWIYHLESIR